MPCQGCRRKQKLKRNISHNLDTLKKTSVSILPVETIKKRRSICNGCPASIKAGTSQIINLRKCKHLGGRNILNIVRDPVVKCPLGRF